MIEQLRPRHLRTRLALWYTAVLGVVLLFSWGIIASLFYWQAIQQMDRFAIQDVETVEGLLYFLPDGRLELRDDYHNHAESKQVLERLMEVRRTSGELLFSNERLGNRSLGGPAQPGEGLNGYSPRTLVLSDGTAVRVVSRQHAVQGHLLLLRVGHSEEPLRESLIRIAWASLLALPLVLAAAGIAGWALARRVLTPLEQMARRAREITPDRLQERLPVGPTGDELDQLAEVINSMLARIDQSFEQLRRFTSDASHELRTPLASIRSVGEVGLQKDGTREQYREVIGSMLEEVSRLTRLIDSLLTISRADAGQIQLHPSVFRVMDLVRETAMLFDVLLEEKNQQLTIEGNESLQVEGDRLFLRQALLNVLDNAVKHSPRQGMISIRVHMTEPGKVEVDISDNGPGIGPEHASKIFDRFYRADSSRSREIGGTGLGLSIAQWVVEANGGRIDLVSKVGRGSTFHILLPATPSSPA